MVTRRGLLNISWQKASAAAELALAGVVTVEEEGGDLIIAFSRENGNLNAARRAISLSYATAADPPPPSRIGRGMQHLCCMNFVIQVTSDRATVFDRLMHIECCNLF